MEKETESYNTFRDAVSTFSSCVKIRASVSPDIFISEFYSLYPQYLYYFDSLCYDYSGLSYRFHLTYQNRDVQFSEIYVTEDKGTILNALDRATESFFKKIVIIAKNARGFEQAYTEFIELSTVNHPNLLNIQCSFYSSEISNQFQIIEVSFEYRIESSILLLHDLETEKEVNRLCKLLFYKGMPDELKIYIAHNYLAKTVLYVDNDHGREKERSYLQSAYGALINHECVCQGYAKAFTMIMQHEHIECLTVSGTANESSSDVLHAWNIVTLKDKGSFHIDVTWDSNLGSGHYEYFCKNDSYTALSHSWKRSVYPICDSSYNIKLTAEKYIRSHPNLLVLMGVPSEYYM